MRKMKPCPHCKRPTLRQHRTYRVNESGWATDASCDVCKRKFAIVHLIYPVERRGDGARALATRFAHGAEEE